MAHSDVDLDRRTAKRKSTPAARMVDLGKREVQLAVHSDPGVFEAEMSDIFVKAWNFVAHECEIQKPGEFVTRYVGRDPVIVLRGEDGRIRTVLNSCSHKGALICRVDHGKAHKFVCPYHGFTFGNDGGFISTPFEQEIYGRLKREELSLRPARTESCAGLIFATFDQNAPSLKEYLGPYAQILDAAFNRDDAGTEVIGPPQRWSIDGNWKLSAEQFAGDGYHTLTCHSSINTAEQNAASMVGVDMAFNGHGARCIDVAGAAYNLGGGARAKTATQDAETLLNTPPAGMTREMVEDFLKRATPAQVRIMARFPPTVGCVFPNFMWLAVELPDSDNPDQVVMMRDIRVMIPVSPEKSEMWSWTVVDRRATEEQKAGALRARSLLFSPIGLIERDDMDSWTRIQEAVRGPVGRTGVARYLAITEPDAEPLIPGMTTWHGLCYENGPWAFFRRWREFMNRDLW